MITKHSEFEQGRGAVWGWVLAQHLLRVHSADWGSGELVRQLLPILT